LIGLQEVSMVKRFSTLVLVIALVCALAGNSAFAITLSDSGTKANVAEARAEAGPAPKKAAKPNERLRRDMLKLVADAKVATTLLTCFSAFVT